MGQRRRFYANISMDVFANGDVITMQRYGYGVNILMDVFANGDVITMQRRRFYAGIPINIFCNINALIVQRRRCCSFDSPGLARDEPTPGKRSQGDSTL